MKEYQDTFNIMNKNRYQVTQDPTETDTDFMTRIDSLEKFKFDPTIFKDRAATEGNRKFMKNLKDNIRINKIKNNKTYNLGKIKIIVKNCLIKN